MALRRVLSPIWEMSTLSMKMEAPSSHSTSLKRAWSREDLPAPVRPTIPTFIPGSTLKERFFKTSSKFSLYRKFTP